MPLTIKNVVVEIECDYCKGKGRFPGGKYQSEGEVIDCPVCNGRRVVRQGMNLDEFHEVLRELVRRHGPI